MLSCECDKEFDVEAPNLNLPISQCLSVKPKRLPKAASNDRTKPCGCRKNLCETANSLILAREEREVARPEFGIE